MTDRYSGVTVTFDRDIRDDDAAALMTAIRMIKGVVEVAPINSEWSPVVRRREIEIGRQIQELGYSLIRGDING